MPLSRLLVLLATLVLACASAQAHVGAFGSAAESARRGFLPELGAASRDFARVTAGRVWENYDCAAESASALCVDAFGEQIARTGTTEVEHLYRGERWDANVAAYDLRARLYSPGNGRFLTQDSFEGFVTDPLSLHKYAFNHNDPVNRVDPSGHMSLMEISISTNVSSALRTTSVAVGRRAVRKVLFGNPPKDAGIVGEMVLDWVLQGFYDHVFAGGITKQEFGQRVHADVKSRCKGFAPINGVTLDCEPFFNDKGPVKGNPKGSLGVDVLIRHHGRPVIAFEIKTGKGMSQSGFNKRRKWIGASVIQITLKPTRK